MKEKIIWNCKKFINDFEKPFFLRYQMSTDWHRVIKTFLYFQNLMQIHERKPGGKLSRSELSQTKNCFKKMKKFLRQVTIVYFLINLSKQHIQFEIILLSKKLYLIMAH